MLGSLYDKLQRVLIVAALGFGVFSFVPVAAASPFGEGVFGANVPFGSQTSLSISLGGNVNLSLSPNGGTLSGSGSHTISVTSTDVVGYSLYIYCVGSTNMVNGGTTIPASANGTAAPLATNTWGYNINGSSNYVGVTTTPSLLKTATGPYKNGDNTTVTYGVLTDSTKSSGTYSVSVTYTAVALTD